MLFLLLLDSFKFMKITNILNKSKNSVPSTANFVLPLFFSAWTSRQPSLSRSPNQQQAKVQMDNDDGLQVLREVVGVTPMEEMFLGDVSVTDCITAIAVDPWAAEPLPGDSRLLTLPDGTALVTEIPSISRDFEEFLKKGYNKQLREEVKHLQELQRKLLKVLNVTAVAGAWLDSLNELLDTEEPELARIRRLSSLLSSDLKKSAAIMALAMGKSQEITLNVVRKSAGLSKAQKSSAYSVTKESDAADLEFKREEDNRKALRSLAASASRPQVVASNPMSSARYYSNSSYPQSSSFGGRGRGSPSSTGGGRGGRGSNRLGRG